MIDALAAIANVTGGGQVELRPASAMSIGEGPTVSFGDAMKATAMKQIETVAKSEGATLSAMNGKTSLQDVVQATVEAELAVETAIAIRNKSIESYQEIMRMPI